MNFSPTRPTSGPLNPPRPPWIGPSRFRTKPPAPSFCPSFSPPGARSIPSPRQPPPCRDFPPAGLRAMPWWASSSTGSSRTRKRPPPGSEPSPPSDLAISAARELVISWTDRDREQPGHWLNGLPPGAVRDAAVSAYVSKSIRIPPLRPPPGLPESEMKPGGMRTSNAWGRVGWKSIPLPPGIGSDSRRSRHPSKRVCSRSCRQRLPLPELRRCRRGGCLQPVHSTGFPA